MKPYYYALISRNESIELTKFGRISLPAESRCIFPCDLPMNEIEENIRSLLLNLNIAEASDYLLMVLSVKALKFRALLDVKIFDVLKVYCFDNDSIHFYKTRINEKIKYCIIPYTIDINKIIRQQDQRKALKILKDEFEIKLERLPPFITSHDLLEKEAIKYLINFKRECKIPKTDHSFFNDVCTLAMIKKNTSYFERYKQQINIADKSSLLKEIHDDNDIQDILHFLDHQENDTLTKYKISLNKSLGLGALDENNFSNIAFCIVYFKGKDIFINQDELKFFPYLVELYANLKQGSFIEEINSAFYLLFMELGFSNMYSSYYNYKELKIYKDFQLDMLGGKEKSESNAVLETKESITQNSNFIKQISDDFPSETNENCNITKIDENKYTNNLGSDDSSSFDSKGADKKINIDDYVLERGDLLKDSSYDIRVDLAKISISEGNYLSAILIFRNALLSILDRNVTDAYEIGAHYLNRLDELSKLVDDWKSEDDHVSFTKLVQEKHGRKTKFWNLYKPKSEKSVPQYYDEIKPGDN